MTDQALSLTMLSLNMHKGFAVFNRRFVLPELKVAVQSVGADLVFLQETLGSHDVFAARYTGWPAEPQHHFLAGMLWGNVAYGRNAVYTEGHHGNAVLSRYPIAEWINHDISVPGQEPRGLLHCVLSMPGRRTGVHALCTHLGLRELERKLQLAQIKAYIDNRVPHDAIVILAGDFNDWRVRANAEMRRRGFEEAFASLRGHSARSFPARWPLLRLDRIYVRGARVLASAVLSAKPWAHLSDHAALTATVAV